MTVKRFPCSDDGGGFIIMKRNRWYKEGTENPRNCDTCDNWVPECNRHHPCSKVHLKAYLRAAYWDLTHQIGCELWVMKCD